MKKSSICLICKKEFSKIGNTKVCSFCKENYKVHCNKCRTEFNPFERYIPSRVLNTNSTLYCSTECSNLAKASKLKQANEIKSIKATDKRNNAQYTCRICKRTYIFKDSYKRFCSKECYEQSKILAVKKGQQTRLKHGYSLSPFSNEETKKKAQLTILSKYGVENVFSSEVVKEKIKKTNIQRYGTPCVFQSEQVKNKIAKTNLKRYGVKNPSQSNVIQDKIRENRKLRYKNKYYNLKGIKKITDKELEQTLLEFYRAHNRKPTIDEVMKIIPYKSKASLYQREKQLSQVDYSILDLIDRKESSLELKVKEFLDENNLNYIRKDKTVIKPLELDFYLPEHKLAIEVNDVISHNSTFSPWGKPKSIDYHYNKTIACKNKGIRLIHAWEYYIEDDRKFSILKSIILSACNNINISIKDTYIEVSSTSSLKEFFIKNSIKGYLEADLAYTLIDSSNKPLISFAIGERTAEIVNIACSFGDIPSKLIRPLWDHLVNNTTYQFLTCSIDLNLYSSNLLDFLESTTVIFEGPVNKKYDTITKSIIRKEDSSLENYSKLWDIWDAGIKKIILERKGWQDRKSMI